jgi:competence CoiA-like predicted nuclease
MSEITEEIKVEEPKKLSYYQRNKDKLLDYQKQYNKDNRPKCVERNKKYYDKEYHRLYYHRKLKPQKDEEVVETVVEIINNTE